MNICLRTIPACDRRINDGAAYASSRSIIARRPPSSFTIYEDFLRTATGMTTALHYSEANCVTV